MAGATGEATLRAWKPAVPGISEVFHARFTEHAYPPHTHDSWTLFIVDEGGIRYDLHRAQRGAAPPMVTLLPPHVVHDGRPASVRGYRKRVVYVDTPVLGEGLIGPAVDRPIIVDPALRAGVAALNDALGCADDALEAETRLHLVAEAIRSRLGAPGREEGTPAHGELAEQLRALLDERIFERITMAEAAARIGARPERLARSFATTFGIPPHAYVIGRRLDAARRRMLDGEPLADVALSVGFFDQAHLTRRFRQYLGTTPGRYAASPQASG